MGSETAVLFAKPGAVKAADKRALSKAGIIVVEIEDPHDVKFVRAQTELPMGDLLAAAGLAINANMNSQLAFGKAVARLMQPSPPGELT